MTPEALEILRFIVACTAGSFIGISVALLMTDYRTETERGRNDRWSMTCLVVGVMLSILYFTMPT
jgi:zinc transporter ZupT